jgi:hypothetical protein
MAQFHTLRSYRNSGGEKKDSQGNAATGNAVSSTIVGEERHTQSLQDPACAIRVQDPSTTGLQLEQLKLSLRAIDQGQHAVTFVTRGKSVLVIPGKRKNAHRTDEPSLYKTSHLPWQLRHGLLMTAMLCIFLFCMVTLTPIGQSVQETFLARLVSSQSVLDVAGRQGGSTTSFNGQTAYASTAYYRALARADAVKYGISPYYYERQIDQESHFDPTARSAAGAIGIAQFTLATAHDYGFDPTDPVASLDGGARYMRNLNREFGYDYRKALAAYNAGPGAVDVAVASCGAAWLSCMDGQPQAYVYIIMGY